MTPRRSIVVSRIGVCTALGADLAVTAAELACDGGRFTTLALAGLRAPVRAAPAPWLPPTAPRGERLAALAGAALRDLGARGLPSERPSLWLGLPDADAWADRRLRAAVTDGLGRAALVRTAPLGRAAFLVALADACAAVAAGRCGQAVVGGVDSRCAPEVVTELAADERLLGPDNRDGLLPGEAAVFVTLERAERGRERAPAVLGVATADEPASFDSGDVNLSTGLSAAFAALRARVDRRVDLVISAQTGETCWAREFSAASLRHAPLMPEPLRTAIVARSFGDAGAAAGGLALVLACLGASGQRTLVHASADAGRVAAAVVVAPRRPLDPVGERVGLWRRAPDVAATPAVASLVEDRVTSHLEVLGMRLAALQRDAVRPADDQAVAARLRAIAVYGPPALECVRRRQADLDADVRAGAAFTLATLR